MLIFLQCDRLSPAWGVTFSTILAHMAQAKLYLSYGLIMDELIKPSNVSLATSSGPLPTPQVSYCLHCSLKLFSFLLSTTAAKFYVKDTLVLFPSQSCARSDHNHPSPLFPWDNFPLLINGWCKPPHTKGTVLSFWQSLCTAVIQQMDFHILGSKKYGSSSLSIGSKRWVFIPLSAHSGNRKP